MSEPTGPVDLPGSFAEITAPWLATVLGAPVEALTIEPLTGTDAGFLGDVARITIERPSTTGDGVPSTLIAKLPPTSPGGRHVGARLDVWAREQAFYREVAPASPGVAVPHCHLAAGDRQQDRWILLLEDCPSEPLLSEPGGGAARSVIEASIDALAGLHGRWWQAETRFEWMPGFDRSDFGALAGLWRDAFPPFLERYGHLVPDETEAWLGEAPAWLPVWSRRVGTEPLTIVHADFRLDNLRHHQGRTTMIDWQTALRGPGAMDLSSLVVTGCAVDDRRSWEPELIDRYHRHLLAAGVEVDQAWLNRSYDENLLWWMGQFSNNLAHLDPGDQEAQAGLDRMIERTFTAAADRDLGRLLADGA